MIDRLPPHSIEAEQGAIGCALLDPNRAADLKSALFYDLRHQVIAAAVQAMVSAGNPLDLLTLVEHLTQAKNLEACGGAGYVAELPDKTGASGNFPYYRDVLQELATLRRILATASDFTARAYETPGPEAGALLDEFERSALAIRDGDGASNDQETIAQQMHGVINELDECVQNQGKLRGLPSGFADLDDLTSGFREGQLIIVAARPSVGKTSLAMNVAERCAVDGKIPVGVFSLEMSARELLFRLTCCRARVSSHAATSGQLSQRDIEHLTVAGASISKAPLHIIDTGGLTIGRLAGMARRLKQRHGIKILIVDYLQLLRGAEKRIENRVNEVTIISSGLKTLAKELRIPVICCAQLNRACETDSKPRKPRLSDLRDSGSIEQDADIVLLLHRSEADNGSTQAVEVIVGKHRNGPTGIINLTFLKEFTRFENASRVQK